MASDFSAVDSRYPGVGFNRAHGDRCSGLHGLAEVLYQGAPVKQENIDGNGFVVPDRDVKRGQTAGTLCHRSAQRHNILKFWIDDRQRNVHNTIPDHRKKTIQRTISNPAVKAIGSAEALKGNSESLLVKHRATTSASLPPTFGSANERDRKGGYDYMAYLRSTSG